MLNDIIKNTEYILNIKLLDLSLGFYIFFVLSFLFIFLINQFFAKIIVSKIAKIVRKTGTKIDDQLFEVFHGSNRSAYNAHRLGD